MSKDVEAADQLMVRYEASKGFDIYPIRHLDYAKPTEREEEIVGGWEPWGWQEAERAFLNHFSLLR
jgi:hypothetical protein